MIDFKELIVGNWLMAPDEHGHMIATNIKNCEAIESSGALKMQPIEITKGLIKHVIKQLNVIRDMLIVVLNSDGTIEIEIMQTKRRIKNLHQLQNIYYDLTGKELKVQL